MIRIASPEHGPMYAWQTLRPSTLVRALRHLRRLLRV